MKKKQNRRADCKCGERNPHSTIPWKTVQKIRAYFRKARPHGARAEAARFYGISQGTLTDILKGRRRVNA